jgi:hypothetical protein
MSNYLDIIFDETSAIRDVAHELNSLSRAFYATGNREMSESLDWASHQLLSSEKNIGNAVSVELNDKCKAAEQSSYNTLVACLSMNIIADSKDAAI